MQTGGFADVLSPDAIIQDLIHGTNTAYRDLLNDYDTWCDEQPPGLPAGTMTGARGWDFLGFKAVLHRW
jgi:hypothetical protein